MYRPELTVSNRITLSSNFFEELHELWLLKNFDLNLFPWCPKMEPHFFYVKVVVVADKLCYLWFTDKVEDSVVVFRVTPKIPKELSSYWEAVDDAGDDARTVHMEEKLKILRKLCTTRKRWTYGRSNCSRNEVEDPMGGRIVGSPLYTVEH